MLKCLVAFAMLSIIPAAPAAAAKFAVTLTGTVLFSAAGSPDPVVGLAFGTGDLFTGRWRVDLDAATPFDVPLAGLSGLQRVYAFAVSGGVMTIAGAGGTTRFTQSAASRGAVVVLDNYAVTGPVRLDQVSIIDGARFEGGLVKTYDSSGGVPPDAFLRSISFGKNLVGFVTAPPNLVSSLERPNFAAILASAAPNVAFFSLSQGTPASAAGMAALPTSNFNIIGPVFSVTAVPEPGSWTLLTIGFGLAGYGMRRRAATQATRATV